MTQHTIAAEIEVKFLIADMPADEREVAYPKVEITYSYSPGSPAVMYQRNGDPGWPAEPAEIELINVHLIDGDGLAPNDQQLREWAYDWLHDAGFDQACEHAEECRRPDPDEARDRMLDDDNGQFGVGA